MKKASAEHCLECAAFNVAKEGDWQEQHMFLILRGEKITEQAKNVSTWNGFLGGGHSDSGEK